MSKKSKGRLTTWSELRFSIVGDLLARPPGQGELQKKLKILADRSYRHPTKDMEVKFGFSTIERWYYEALAQLRAFLRF